MPATKTAPTLNPEQQAVVDHESGPMLVASVAGSGKTTAVVERVARLVTLSRVPAPRILLVAFNVDAAAQLNRRLVSRVPHLADTGDVARTTHSTALQIFNAETERPKEWRIDSSGALYSMATRQAARGLGIQDPPLSLTKHLAGRVKNNLIPYNEVLLRLGVDSPINDAIEEEAENVLRHVTDTHKSGIDTKVLMDLFLATEATRTSGVLIDGAPQRFIGFDDMLHSAANLLRKPEIRAKWSKRYEHVIVDEAQDLNMAQHELLEALAAPSRNYMLVGDAAQCVYSFRGARPDYLTSFAKRWSGCKVVRMVRNYRSGKQIISTANVVLDFIPNDDRLGMKIRGERSDPGFVNYRELPDTDAEAMNIAENARRHHEAGVEWKDMAILVRLLAQTKAIELALLDAKIPARMVSGQSFFTLRETRLLLSSLKVCLGVATAEDFSNAILYPPRFLGKPFVAYITGLVPKSELLVDWVELLRKLLREQRESLGDSRQQKSVEIWTEMMHGLRFQHDQTGQTPIRVLREIITQTEFMDWLARQTEIEADSSATENVERVKDFVAEFTDGKSLFERLDALAVQRKVGSAARNAITVSTVHKAKGLEWSTVFVAGMAKGVFPAATDNASEEDRVAYVAMTRAKNELWLSRPMVDHRGRETSPSPYIEALALDPDLAPLGPRVRGDQLLLGG